MTTERIGFIGLGNIGKPMAVNLAKSDLACEVFDHFPAACESFAKRDIAIAESPADMASRCTIIGVCVRDDADVEAVLCGEQGILSQALPETIVAVHSTVSQETILRLAAVAAQTQVHLVDVPVSGGAGGAKAQTLCYMFGGPSELLERCRPVFETSGSTLVDAGDLGAGIALKLCNNLITYAQFTALHEAAKLAEASGLSYEVLKTLGSNNGVITEQMSNFIEGRDNCQQGMSEADFRSIFAGFAALGVKDLQAALQSAEQVGIELPATAKTAELIEKVFYKAY